ncbi:PTS sugar transporter subunit IIA [Erysipelotrichaceae bacterium 51-3]
MIWEELDKNLIFQNLEAEKSDDVFEKLGGEFIRYGYAKDSYIRALKERESDFPTGLDIGGFGIAIPHTDISHVNKDGVAIASLKKPVHFIQMGTNDEPVDVNLVFMLSVKDPAKHMSHLQRIVEIIQDQRVLEKIKAAEACEGVINIIKDKEIQLETAA